MNPAGVEGVLNVILVKQKLDFQRPESKASSQPLRRQGVERDSFFSKQRMVSTEGKWLV